MKGTNRNASICLLKSQTNTGTGIGLAYSTLCVNVFNLVFYKWWCIYQNQQ